MSSPDTRLERMVFHPAILADLGVPERCRKCPGMNDFVSRLLRSDKFLHGSATRAEHVSAVLSKDSQTANREAIANRPNVCGGYVALTDEEVKPHLEDVKVDVETVVSSVGIRCGTQDETIVAAEINDYSIRTVVTRPSDWSHTSPLS